MGLQEQEKRFQDTAREIIEFGYPEPLWQLVKNFSLQYLEKGRVNFDIPHTRGTVDWVFRLATDYNQKVESGEIPDGVPVDVIVLVTAAWPHDIGYYGEFDEEASLSQVGDKKARHMAVGAEMAGRFLREHAADYLSQNQIIQVVNLDKVHDNLDHIESVPEKILLEADTLGAMDVSWVEPTYKGVEALNYLVRERMQKRYDLFITPLGLESLQVIRGNFEQFIINRDFGGIPPGSIQE